MALVSACLLTGCAGQAENSSLTESENQSASDLTSESASSNNSAADLENNADENTQGESFVDNLENCCIDCSGTLYSYDSTLSYFSGEKGGEKLELMEQMPDIAFEEYFTAENQIDISSLSYKETNDVMDIRLNETNLGVLLDKGDSLYTFSANGTKYAASVFKYAPAGRPLRRQASLK